MIIPKGDTEKQAFLRDKLIKQGDDEANIYDTFYAKTKIKTC